MGKNQKLKEQRKIDKVRKQLTKEKKLKLSGLITVGIIVGIIGGTGVYFGTLSAKNWFDSSKKTKSALSTNIKSYKKGDHMYSKAPDMQIDTNKTYVAKFETNKGDFDVEFFTKDAPKTVNNFVTLARDGFYDGLTFHRVIKDFMIQGGDPKGDGTGDPGYKFADEFNSHKLVKGTLAMANSGANTNGSQFFVVTKDATDWLDGKHTAFGNVTSGLDVVMKIQDVPVGENDKPAESVIINKVSIEEK